MQKIGFILPIALVAAMIGLGGLNRQDRIDHKEPNKDALATFSQPFQENQITTKDTNKNGGEATLKPASDNAKENNEEIILDLVSYPAN